jgi:hypothetical protein
MIFANKQKRKELQSLSILEIKEKVMKMLFSFRFSTLFEILVIIHFVCQLEVDAYKSGNLLLKSEKLVPAAFFISNFVQLIILMPCVFKFSRNKPFKGPYRLFLLSCISYNFLK